VCDGDCQTRKALGIRALFVRRGVLMSTACSCLAALVGAAVEPGNAFL
jgi:hypothetical protein